jgi:hypothetical protein
VHLDQGTQGLRPSDGIFMPRSFVVADLGGGPGGCCCYQVTHFHFFDSPSCSALPGDRPRG